MIQLSAVDIRTLFRERNISLPSLLHGAWWVLLAFSLMLLVLDILVFYRYGTEREPDVALRRGEPLRIEEERIRSAADAIRERTRRFESPATAAIPNPFR